MSYVYLLNWSSLRYNLSPGLITLEETLGLNDLFHSRKGNKADSSSQQTHSGLLGELDDYE
jgi:hypothetical protein